MNWTAIRKAIHRWVVAGSDLPGEKVVWARQPGSPRPPAPAIIMEISTINGEDMSWVDMRCGSLQFDDLSVEMVSDSNLIINSHGLLTGDGPVRVRSGLPLPSPLAEGVNYWVIKTSDNTIQLASTFARTGGGHAHNPVTPIVLTTVGGPFTVYCTDETLRAGQELEYVQRGLVRLTLTLTAYTAEDVSEDACTALLHRVVSRARLPSQRDTLDGANVGFQSAERVRSMSGTRDATLFEPRAWVDIHLSTAYCEVEYGTIIERFSVENLDTGQVIDVPED